MREREQFLLPDMKNVSLSSRIFQGSPSKPLSDDKKGQKRVCRCEKTQFKSLKIGLNNLHILFLTETAELKRLLLFYKLVTSTVEPA